ncbi:MAG: hypothetical protein ACTSRA_12430, partial [Promethearchaeota archaeon]
MVVDNEFERKVIVDFWKTDLHSEEIGIYEHERKRAKSRAFTKDLDLIGSVNDGDEKGIFGYRKNAWEPDVPKSSVDYYTRKRLIIRWFKKARADNIIHVGTLEEMVMDSIRKTMIANDPLHSFRVLIGKYPYVITLSKEHARLPGRVGEMWGFSIMTDPAEKTWEFFLLDERRFTIGTDFDVKKDKVKEVFVKIDEKILNIGKKVEISFYNRRLYECEPF